MNKLETLSLSVYNLVGERGSALQNSTTRSLRPCSAEPTARSPARARTAPLCLQAWAAGWPIRARDTGPGSDLTLMGRRQTGAQELRDAGGGCAGWGGTGGGEAGGAGLGQTPRRSPDGNGVSSYKQLAPGKVTSPPANNKTGLRRVKCHQRTRVKCHQRTRHEHKVPVQPRRRVPMTAHGRSPPAARHHGPRAGGGQRGDPLSYQAPCHPC